MDRWSPTCELFHVSICDDERLSLDLSSFISMFVDVDSLVLSVHWDDSDEDKHSIFPFLSPDLCCFGRQSSEESLFREFVSSSASEFSDSLSLSSSLLLVSLEPSRSGTKAKSCKQKRIINRIKQEYFKIYINIQSKKKKKLNSTLFAAVPLGGLIVHNLVFSDGT